MLEDLTSVLTFAAFRPDSDDPAIPWSRRFQKRKSLIVNASRGNVSWRAINRRGKFQESGADEGELADVARAHAEDWRALADGGWCALSLNNRVIISLENNLSRRENYVELLRTNPKAVLGAKYDRGKRYAVYHHPENQSSILMAADDAFIKTAEDALRGAGMKAGRVCCGLFAMLETKLTEIYASGKPEAKRSFMLIATCEGSIVALVQTDGQWTDLRCRSGMGVESVEAIYQIAEPLIQKLEPGTPVLYLHDGIDQKFAAEMMKLLEPAGAQDVSAENQLWTSIGTN